MSSVGTEDMSSVATEDRGSFYGFVCFFSFDSIRVHIKDCELLLKQVCAKLVDGSF